MKIRKVENETIQYDQGFNYHVELCHVTCTLPHCHPHDIELVYCLEGNLRLVSGEQVFTLEAGSLYSIDYNENHFMTSEKGALVLIFNMDLRRTFMDWNQLRYRIFTCESSHCFPYQAGAMEKLKDLLLALGAAKISGDISPQRTSSSADKVISILTEYFDWFNYNNHDKYMNPELHSRFYRSLEYCFKNYMHKINASDLAEREHINSNYFSQFLASTVFNSFSHMVKYVRCYHGEHLLLRTDMPNYEIAYSVGFSDPKYFYSAFEYWWKRSPKEHRNLYKNQFLLWDKTDQGIVSIKGAEASKIIQEYISRWHLIKFFG